MGLFGGSDDDLRPGRELERRSPRWSGHCTPADRGAHRVARVEILKPQSGVSDLVRQLAIRGDKIAAIKLLRDETGLGLREAKDVVDGLA